jgi:hypothetical protein
MLVDGGKQGLLVAEVVVNRAYGQATVRAYVLERGIRVALLPTMLLLYKHM